MNTENSKLHTFANETQDYSSFRRTPWSGSSSFLNSGLSRNDESSINHHSLKGRWYAFALILVSIYLALISQTSVARVIAVGPNGEVRTIREAAILAKDGDVVEISSGEWHGDVTAWGQRKLTIRGVGGRPILFADGKHSESKAIWVFRNGDFIVDNIEFRGARVPDGNGAGIRLETGQLTITRCAFFDNQNGILTSSSKDSALSIDSSIFADAPIQPDPPPHLLYVGAIASLKITGSRFHTGHDAHLIKSRARVSDIRYNLIADGPSGTASYEVDLPNGGKAALVANIIVQSKTTSNPVMVAFGAEGNPWPDSQLVLANNTLISKGLTPTLFIRAWRKNLPQGTSVHTFNNLYSGIGLFDYGLAGQHKGNIPIMESAFLDSDTLDFRLDGLRWLRHLSYPLPAEYADYRPKAEFSFPIGTRKVTESESLLPGAFQPQNHGY